MPSGLGTSCWPLRVQKLLEEENLRVSQTAGDRDHTQTSQQRRDHCLGHLRCRVCGGGRDSKRCPPSGCPQHLPTSGLHFPPECLAGGGGHRERRLSSSESPKGQEKSFWVLVRTTRLMSSCHTRPCAVTAQGGRTRICPVLQTWRMGSGAVAKRARQEMLEQPHNQNAHFRKPPTRTWVPKCVHKPGERRLLAAQPFPAERGLCCQEGDA